MIRRRLIKIVKHFALKEMNKKHFHRTLIKLTKNGIRVFSNEIMKMILSLALWYSTYKYIIMIKSLSLIFFLGRYFWCEWRNENVRKRRKKRNYYYHYYCPICNFFWILAIELIWISIVLQKIIKEEGYQCFFGTLEKEWEVL